MGKKLSISMFFAVMLLLLPMENQAIKRSEAPTPQPQPQRAHPPTNGSTPNSLNLEDCDPHCRERCSQTQFKKPCLFFCNKCCAKCLCVPAGTYGNKETCPCYNNWKTKRGGPKCP